MTGDFGTYGTDGGLINFLRYLERWTSRTANYRGSIASFFFHRQGTGSYKCCNNVYTAPTRNYGFDVDFLDPNLLPPGTPMFHDINVMGFTYKVLPGA